MTRITDTRVWRLTDEYRNHYDDMLRTTDEVMALADNIDPATGSAEYYINIAPERIERLSHGPYMTVAELIGYRSERSIYSIIDGDLCYRIPGMQHADRLIDDNDNPIWLLITDTMDAAVIEQYIEEHSEDEAAIRAALS
ncbi:MAG: hypothetical protein WC455_14730 [Dehalococcoidia bacterium]|jgi:hypothetical protein